MNRENLASIFAAEYCALVVDVSAHDCTTACNFRCVACLIEAAELKSVDKLMPKDANGKEIPSLKFESMNTIKVYHKYLPFVWTSSNINEYVVFSKGIGITYFRAQTSEGEVAKTLIDIRRLE